MGRRRRTGFAALAILMIAIGIWLWFESKDPEDRTLDATSRLEAPGKFVQLTDGITHYNVAGPEDGQVVVFAAGFSVPYYIWDPLFKAVADSGFRTIRYDYFGRGWSDRVKGDYTRDFYVRQLRELLDSLRVKGPVHLAGLSYGGAIVTTFATRYPELVRSIIYVDATHPEPSAASRRAQSWLAWHRYMLFEGGTEQLASGQLDDFLHPELHPDWPGRYSISQQFKGTREAIRRAHLGIASGRSQKPMLRGIAERKTPVLIVWGAQDRIVSFEETDELRKALPQATFVTVDSAGHLPHIEQPAAVVRAVTRFLRAHRRQGAPGSR